VAQDGQKVPFPREGRLEAGKELGAGRDQRTKVMAALQTPRLHASPAHLVLQEIKVSRLVAHACNPSYSGGREIRRFLRVAFPSQPRANSSGDPPPHLEKQIAHKKRAGEVAQGLVCEFKPQYRKK
jgi:hypothetical protein